MKNLVFVLWMLGYPLITALDRKWNKQPIELKAATAITVIFVWIAIGVLLYE
jgi:hypothetical protein